MSTHLARAARLSAAFDEASRPFQIRVDLRGRRWVATVPGFPELLTRGRTAGEALARMKALAEPKIVALARGTT